MREKDIMKVELMPGKGIIIDGTVIELGQNIKNIKLNSESPSILEVSITFVIVYNYRQIKKEI